MRAAARPPLPPRMGRPFLDAPLNMRSDLAVAIAAIVAVTAMALVTGACSNPQGPEGPGSSTTSTTTTSIAPAASIPLPAGFTPSYAEIEDFEDGLPGAPWNFAAGSEAAAWSRYPPAGTPCVSFSAMAPVYQGDHVSVTRSISLSEPANLRFRVRTDIGSDLATDFSFLLDGEVHGTWNGLGGAWFPVDTLLSAGGHVLEWTLTKGSNSYYPSAVNMVWLDDVSLASVGVAMVQVHPEAPQEVIEGGSVAYQAVARRSDGSTVTAAPMTWELVAGTGTAMVDASGLVSTSAAGVVGLRASSGGLGSATSAVSILPTGWLDLPVVHQGTTYTGKAAGGSGNPRPNTETNVTITSPTVSGFSADAFFTIRGSVSGTGADQYACIRLSKASDATESTTYFVRKDFALRIWLRFGPGDYRVTVYPIQVTNGNLDYEGDINGWSSTGQSWVFDVTNTNQEDGRFIYPSDPLQADDLAIRNLAARIVHGKTGDHDRLLALHDHVVSTLYYDDASLVDGARKKQDALSVLASGTAVCEGYTSLFGALARAAGFSVKAASGHVGAGLHAWNLVSTGGAWPMVDCTWDDPGRDDDNPESVRYDYFLVTGPNGTLGDHSWEDDREDRSLGIGDLPSPGGFGAWPAGGY